MSVPTAYNHFIMVHLTNQLLESACGAVLAATALVKSKNNKRPLTDNPKITKKVMRENTAAQPEVMRGQTHFVDLLQMYLGQECRNL